MKNKIKKYAIILHKWKRRGQAIAIENYKKIGRKD